MPAELLAGRYAILRPLGRGGMGDVLLVRDTRDGREVALKQLHLEDEEAAARFRDEFSILARIEHPNVVRVFDYGLLPGKGAYFTLEHLEGQAIDAAVSPGDVQAALRAVLDVAAGLEVLHEAGVLHCDLKPSNILLVPSGGRPVARLLDFGLAGRAGRTPGASWDKGGAATPDSTRVRGTPGFVSPEVLAGAPYSRASDLYALGATLYRVLSGRAAFPGRNEHEVRAAQQRGRPSALPLRAVGIPAALEQAVLGLLETEPPRRLEAWADLRRLAERHAGERFQALGHRGAFVGREAERRRLSERLLRERIQLAVVRGASGSGRTRLAREASVEAELAGWDVEWFDLDRPPSVGSPPRAAETPVLLVLDDVDQWSARELRNLGLDHRTRPLSILATVEDAGGNDEWAGALLALPEDPARTDLVLGDLSSDAIRALVRGRLATDVPEELVQVLVRHAGGLPGALHLALDRLLAHFGPGAEWIHDAAGASAVLERASASEVEGLVAGATPAALDALLDLACAETGLPLPEEVARELLWRNAIDRADGGWILRSRAAADRVRSALLREASRSRLSELAARASETTRGLRIRGEIALALDDTPRAREQLLAAVRSTEEPRDPDATAALDLLLSHLVDRAAKPDSILLELSAHYARLGQDRRVAELLAIVLASSSEMDASAVVSAAYDRARALHRLGNYEEAQRTLDAAAPRLEASGFSAGQWWSQRALNLQFLGRFVESKEEYERALALTPASESQARAGILNRFGIMAYLNIDVELGRSLLREAREQVANTDRTLTSTLIDLNFALVESIEGNLTASMQGYRAGVSFFESTQDRARLGQGIANFANVAAIAGQWDLAEELSTKAEAIARERSNPQLLLNVLATRANMAIRRGLISDARSIQRAERSWISSVQRAEARLHHIVHRAEVLRLIGNDARSGRFLRPILSPASSMQIPRYLALAQITAGTILGRRGRIPEAERMFLRALNGRTKDIQILESANLELARLSAWTTSVPSIRQAIEFLLGEHPASCAGTALRMEAHGWQAHVTGDLDEAATYFDEALGEYRRLGLMTLYVELGHLAGLAFASTPRRQRAVQWLTLAHSAARSYGMTGLARQIADELVELTGGKSIGSSASTTPERETLYRVSEILNSALDPSSLLPRALAVVCDRIGAERGFVLLTSDDGSPRPVAQYGHVDDEARASALEVSKTVIRRVTTSGELFRSDDASSDPRLGSTLSILDMSVRSLLCVPLRLGDEVIGTIYAENRSSAGQFEEDQVELVEAFANLVAVAIQNARLHEELRRARDRVVGENLSLRREVSGRFKPNNLIGQSAVIEQILGEVERIAQSRATVLITGESGTGKDLFAKTIHFASPRADRPFLSLNCAALPADLIESELFGIEARVATGVDRRLGIFERADGGTLFLDEIGDMPLDLQAKLLRVLQEREFTRIGGSDVVRVDVRLIAATNQDLQDLIRTKKFREDLYFRIHTLPIHLPPLRERKVDIPLLAKHFLVRFCEENGMPVPRMSAAFTETLLRSQWPGNVRELQNYMERSVVMSQGPVLEPVVLPSDLEPKRRERRGTSSDDVPGSAVPPSLNAARQDAERTWILKALSDAGGNQRRAAAMLAMPEPTLRYRMRRLGITRDGAAETLKSQKPTRQSRK